MKSIAIFQKDLNIGGIEKSLINMLKIIDYTKYEVDLYLFEKDNKLENEIDSHVNVIKLDKLPEITKLISFNILKRIYKSKIKKEYDIAIDYSSYNMDCALNVSLINAKKKIMWIHNDIEIKLKEEYKYRLLYNAFKDKFNYYDSFVAVSNGAKDSFIKVTKTKKEINVIPNGIDVDEIIKLKDLKTDFKVNDKVINIVSTGRLVHQKGFDILINEFKKVIDKNNNYHLYIIGDGDEKDNLNKLIEQLNLNDYITLTGITNNPFNMMNKCDAFILTSRYEGQGMAIMEAKCLGLDIIIPKHLEKYVDDISGCEDLINAILNLNKNNNKKYDMLEKYNNNIIKSINNL